MGLIGLNLNESKKSGNFVFVVLVIPKQDITTAS